MKISRRNFIEKTTGAFIIGAMAASGSSAFAGITKNESVGTSAQDNNLPSDKMNDVKVQNISNNSKLILPRALAEGSTVAIIAPASHVAVSEVARGSRFLKKYGINVELGETVRNSKLNDKYLSAEDHFRAEEFMNYIKRADVDCIFTARGGYGTMRILDYLDYDVIRANPKIIIGYSDITALINAIHVRTGLVTFHGPVASSDFDDLQRKSFLSVLIKEASQQPALGKYKVEYKYNRADILAFGSAEGRLVGGNLSMVTATLGTPYEINSDNSILFLEETREEPYKIDKMLTQLALAGKFKKVKGVVFGHFKNLDQKRNFYPGRSFTVRQVLLARIEELGVPSLVGMPIGHHDDNVIIPIGVKALLEADKKTLTIIENPVC